MNNCEENLATEFRRNIRVEHYRGRIRVELSVHTPLFLQRLALGLWMPCVECFHPIHPFRRREGPNLRQEREVELDVLALPSIYYTCTCPPDESIRCCRTLAASEEYEKIKDRRKFKKSALWTQIQAIGRS